MTSPTSRTLIRGVAAVGLTAMSIVSIPSSAGAAELGAARASVVASFEGQEIRLADGWGNATACVAVGDDVDCYRTRGEMERAAGADADMAALAAGCSGFLYLYSDPGYGGAVLALSTQGVTTNLSPYGFSNITSSYHIGPCSARFYDTTSGGSAYPGNTGAGVWASGMVSGWDNRVSSVYIN